MSKQNMIPGIDELLSAFLDGETSPTETRALLARLGAEPSLQATLDRHHRLRAGLHDELHPGLDDDFSSRVMAGIEAVEERPVTKVVSLVPRRAHPLARAVLGLAMAASIAAVTVLTIPMLIPSTDSALRIADIRSLDQGNASQHWDELSPAAAAELNNYLLSHNNSAMGHGLNSTMGFMRVAADEPVAFDWAGR